MRILILGGTGWLGREIAHAALATGHEVTCLARGSSGAVPEGARLIQADRDRRDAYAEVATKAWDGVIDLARQPGHARRAIDALADSTDRWAFVSSKNVYRSHVTPDGDETSALLEPLASDVMSSTADYGAAKAACEQAVLSRYGSLALIARAGLIGGPGDTSGRSGYWPWRFARPSNPSHQVLVPRSDIAASIIDVRDLARWLIDFASGAVEPGIYDALANTATLGDFLAAARAVAEAPSESVLAEPAWLLAHGVAEWAGPKSLPLWVADPDWLGFGGHSGERIKSNGLQARPLEETFGDVLRWELDRPAPGPHGAGLSDQEEAELLAALTTVTA